MELRHRTSCRGAVERGGRKYAGTSAPDGTMIACGRKDGSVQWWGTDGEMIEAYGGVTTV
jgi:hypothetical protein